jgi:N-acetylneuraminic acid mutarotase
VMMATATTAMAKDGPYVTFSGGATFVHDSDIKTTGLATVEEGIVPSSDQIVTAPTDVSIAVNGTSATITWSPVFGATGYNVYVISDLAQKIGTVTGVSSGPYTIAGLSYGQRYYIMVATCRGSLESAPSHLACATVSASGTLAWQTSAPMPSARMEAGAAVANGICYVVGGHSGTSLGTMDAFDPATGQWTGMTPMPTARRMPVVTALNGKIYAMGGMSYVDQMQVSYSNANEVYDPATGNWSAKKPLPNVGSNSVYGNRFIGGAAANGKIYVAMFSPGSNATFEYDPVADTWTSKAPIPIGDYKPYSFAALNNKLYFLTSTSFAEYDPANDLWTLKPPLASYRSLVGLVGVTSRNKLYAIGGVDSSGNVLQSVAAYDPAANAWTADVPLPVSLKSAAAADVSGKVYLFGGVSNADDFYAVPLDQVLVGHW